MALTFPNPAVDPEYVAPNGITYIWDDTDEKWRVKGFKVEAPDSRLPYRIESEQFGDPQIQLVDAEDNFTNVKFLAENGIVIRPAGADQITFDTDALTPKADFINLSEAQQDLADDVTTLINKVDALEGTVVDGRWTLDNRTVAREGHFIPFTGISPSVVWAGTDGLQLNSLSADGKTYTFAEINIGDVIRIGAPGSSAVFRCNTAPELAGDCYNIGVELLNSDGPVAEGLTFGFEFLNSFDPSSYATVSYVDAQDNLDLKLTGGLLTGNLVMAGGNEAAGAHLYMVNKGFIRFGWGDRSTVEEYGGYIFMRNADTFEIGSYGDIVLKFIGQPLFDKSPAVPNPTLDTHAANKFYVDNQIGSIPSVNLDGYLPLTGGTLTGTLTGMLFKSTRETGYAFEVKPGNTGDATAFIHTNGDLKAKKVKVEPDLASGADRPFEIKGRLSDGSTVSKDFFYMYANSDGTPSAMNYDGKMNSDKNLVNKKYVTDKDNYKVPGHFTYENGHLFYNTGA